MEYGKRERGGCALRKCLDHETAMEFINDLIMAVLDGEGLYTFVSPGWERYTGFSADEVIGQRVWDIIPDTAAGEVLRTGKPVFGNPVCCRQIPAFTTYIPRFAPDGTVSGVFLYVIINGLTNAQQVIQQINTLTRELDFYKHELSRERGARYGLDNIIGKSESIRHLKEQIIQAARSSSTVLIEGETGCGKELIAHAIHAASPRRTSRFVRVNCSAIPGDLMESEFFGYAAGAFTGASKRGKIGRFELADGGSIFLDEVNLLTATMQPKFLRVIQEMEVDPVGGNKSVPIDVRVIAASNVSLENLVEIGQFRSDLFFRLNVIRIQAEPLRSRKEDIPLLVTHLIQKLNLQLGMVIESVEPEVMNILLEHDWPGNVRELQNVIESAMNMADSPTLRKKDFDRLIKRMYVKNRTSSPETSVYHLKSAKRVFERELVKDALTAAEGNRVRTAELLGISRNVLYQKMNQYNLK